MYKDVTISQHRILILVLPILKVIYRTGRTLKRSSNQTTWGNCHVAERHWYTMNQVITIGSMEDLNRLYCTSFERLGSLKGKNIKIDPSVAQWKWNIDSGFTWVWTFIPKRMLQRLYRFSGLVVNYHVTWQFMRFLHIEMVRWPSLWRGTVVCCLDIDLECCGLSWILRAGIKVISRQ